MERFVLEACSPVWVYLMNRDNRVLENLRTLEKLAELFDNHDLDRIMEPFADDCSLDLPRGAAPWGTRYLGKTAVRGGLRTRFEMLPDVHYGDLRHFAAEDVGVSETTPCWRWHT